MKFYLVNLSNPAKTEKTHGRITSEQEINPVQIPHPSNAMFKFPLPRHDAQSNARGMPGGGGGVLKFRIDRRIKIGFRLVLLLVVCWKAYPTRLQGEMGNLLMNLPNLGYGSPLQEINHMGKCLWYFHPSYGSNSGEITAE